MQYDHRRDASSPAVSTSIYSSQIGNDVRSIAAIEHVIAGDGCNSVAVKVWFNDGEHVLVDL